MPNVQENLAPRTQAQQAQQADQKTKTPAQSAGAGHS